MDQLFSKASAQIYDQHWRSRREHSNTLAETLPIIPCVDGINALVDQSITALQPPMTIQELLLRDQIIRDQQEAARLNSILTHFPMSDFNVTRPISQANYPNLPNCLGPHRLTNLQQPRNYRDGAQRFASPASMSRPKKKPNASNVPSNAEIKRKLESTLPDEVKMRLQKQRERNCAAATRCREKKRTLIDNLTRENNNYKRYIRSLESFIESKGIMQQFTVYHSNEHTKTSTGQ